MKIFFRVLPVVLAAFCGIAIPGVLSASPKAEADTIYINGNIYTVNETFSRASGIVVKDGKILYVGDGAQKKYRSASPVVDLGGEKPLSPAAKWSTKPVNEPQRSRARKPCLRANLFAKGY